MGQMKEAGIQMLVTSTSKQNSLAEIFDALRRGTVSLLKDAEMYLYFCIARYAVWKELRRRKRSGSGND